MGFPAMTIPPAFLVSPVRFVTFGCFLVISGLAGQENPPIPAVEPEISQPNVVLIFCDDMGYGDLGCYGSPRNATPNIDRLASEGLRFTDFYSAYCVCSASRASLMTGCYQARISMPGVISPGSRVALNPDEITIADLLKSKGYATACIGKWHLGDSPQTLPTAQGFDSYFGIPYSNDMKRKRAWGNDATNLDRIWRERRWDIYENELYRDTKVVESPVDQTTLTVRYTDEAIAFIEANRERSFFLYWANAMPHVPLFVPDDRFDPNPHEAYRLTIEHIDDCVGRVMETLDRLDLAKDTWVIFTSDNGPWLSKKHHGGSAGILREGKGTVYEGGMRVPCVMRWPSHIPTGKVSDQVASTIDFLPTLAAITGAEISEDRPVDGRDIRALLDDSGGVSPHDEEGFYYYRFNKPQAVRVGKWKLKHEVVGKPELYDLRADPGETRDLVKEQPKIVERLKAMMKAKEEQLKTEARPPWKAREAKKAAEAG